MVARPGETPACATASDVEWPSWCRPTVMAWPEVGLCGFDRRRVPSTSVLAGCGVTIRCGECGATAERGLRSKRLPRPRSAAGPRAGLGREVPPPNAQAPVPKWLAAAVPHTWFGSSAQAVSELDDVGPSWRECCFGVANARHRCTGPMPLSIPAGAGVGCPDAEPGRRDWLETGIEAAVCISRGARMALLQAPHHTYSHPHASPDQSAAHAAHQRRRKANR
jgi:hypothetical protein